MHLGQDHFQALDFGNYQIDRYQRQVYELVAGLIEEPKYQHDLAIVLRFLSLTKIALVTLNLKQIKKSFGIDLLVEGCLDPIESIEIFINRTLPTKFINDNLWQGVHNAGDGEEYLQEWVCYHGEESASLLRQIVRSAEASLNLQIKKLYEYGRDTLRVDTSWLSEEKYNDYGARDQELLEFSNRRNARINQFKTDFETRINLIYQEIRNDSSQAVIDCIREELIQASSLVKRAKFKIKSLYKLDVDYTCAWEDLGTDLTGRPKCPEQFVTKLRKIQELLKDYTDYALATITEELRIKYSIIHHDFSDLDDDRYKLATMQISEAQIAEELQAKILHLQYQSFNIVQSIYEQVLNTKAAPSVTQSLMRLTKEVGIWSKKHNKSMIKMFFQEELERGALDLQLDKFYSIFEYLDLLIDSELREGNSSSLITPSCIRRVVDHFIPYYEGSLEEPIRWFCFYTALMENLMILASIRELYIKLGKYKANTTFTYKNALDIAGLTENPATLKYKEFCKLDNSELWSY